ncbi:MULTISPECIES: response regulator [Rhodomicrobium]|uniref:response regulator n=1 Tax=Rhodomicrobium TaxID=1068 RepID=UPI000B4BD4A1|nr:MULTISPECIES: response regulator [Rhodomicrobium]
MALSSCAVLHDASDEPSGTAHSGSRPVVSEPVITKPPRILIVDDDEATRQMLVEYFEANELVAATASSRQDLLSHFASSEPSLILLDLRLGREDGFDLLREIRTSRNVPVIITTGARLDEVDRIVGLELGADDYVTKPFCMRELLARVRAVLRRYDIGRISARREPEQGGYRFDGWRLERRSRRLFNPTGQPVTLTKGEYALLVAFLGAPQRALSREQLLHATRMHEDVFDRSIDVHVLRLRRKLEPDPSAPRFILTERGVGYVFAIPVETF